MGTLIKFVLGGAALFFALGGPRMFKKKPADRPKPPVSDVVKPGKPVTPPPTLPVDQGGTSSAPIRLDNRIAAMDWLRSNLEEVKGMPKKVGLTYYLLANSKRLAFESLDACLREKITAQKIDPEEFQYTYFLDRVMMAGSGRMTYEGKEYFTRYDLLRKAGWNKGKHAGRNNYTCRSFSWKSKNALEFIRKNLKSEAVFIPVEKAPAPNGRTASGQEAIDWVTVSVNPKDFPMSVPNKARRQQLSKRFSKEGKKAPKARSYILLITENQGMYLTEAMDTGGGVKEGWVDWRIGNSAEDIARFHRLGKTAMAYCFTSDDPNMTLDKILRQLGREITKK